MIVNFLFLILEFTNSLSAILVGLTETCGLNDFEWIAKVLPPHEMVFVCEIN